MRTTKIPYPLLAAWLALSGCPVGAVSQKALPSLNASQAMGVDERCTPEAMPEYAKPLIVDMPAAERGDLELAMRDGMVVVQYDCQALRIVPDCTVASQYAYAPFNLKEEVVRLTNADEIKANLPFSAGAVGVDLDGGLERGAALDIALLIVGKERSTRAQVTRADLVEARPGACTSATHFVRGATLGAFALDTSSSATLRGAAELFAVPGLGPSVGAGASSQSTRSMQGHDGSMEACRQASLTDTAPPAECSALLRLELTVIDAQGTPAEAAPRDELTASLCAQGMVWQDGKCTRNTGTRHTCAPGDVADCREQCSQGDGMSCARVGYYLKNGSHGLSKDLPTAAQLFRQGCDLGEPKACSNLAELYLRGMGVPLDEEKGMALVEESCKRGGAEMCSLLAGGHYVGSFVPKDDAKAASYARIGCSGGAGEGCFIWGELARKGLGGVAKDPALARSLYARGCEGGAGLACYGLGVALEEGIGGDKQPQDARMAFQKACDAGMPEGCKALK